MVLKHTYDINKLGFTVKSSKSRREMKSTIQNNKYSLSSAPLQSSPGGPQPTRAMHCRTVQTAGGSELPPMPSMHTLAGLLCWTIEPTWWRI